jgi:ABC-type lipoprotein export system ATPase subunit
MMAEGRVKMVFPGGNTCLGFYSFYNYIIGEEARRIFVLKGGPGTGKSTFMNILLLLLTPAARHFALQSA